MRSHNNHALKRLVSKCECLWGGGGGNNTIPWSNPSSIRYELATGKYNPHLFLTVKRIFNTESNHGISAEVKWIGIRHLMKKKGKIPLSLKPLYTSMKRRIARKTDRETHFNSLHLHMLGDKKDFSSKCNIMFIPHPRKKNGKFPVSLKPLCLWNGG